jgi:hypothetical protein
MEVWTPTSRRLALFVGQEDASPTKSGAQASAFALAEPLPSVCAEGSRLTMSFRFTSATPIPERWRCTPANGGVSCGFDGEAACDLEERQVQNTKQGRCAPQNRITPEQSECLVIRRTRSNRTIRVGRLLRRACDGFVTGS